MRTITRALQLAGNGDTIVLANTNVPYRENISLVGSRHSGTPQQPFTIRGNGAILDGSAPVPPEAWESYRGAVFRFSPPRMGYQQLFLDDRPAVRVFASRTARSSCRSFSPASGVCWAAKSTSASSRPNCPAITG